MSPVNENNLTPVVRVGLSVDYPYSPAVVPGSQKSISVTIFTRGFDCVFQDCLFLLVPQHCHKFTVPQRTMHWIERLCNLNAMKLWWLTITSRDWSC